MDTPRHLMIPVRELKLSDQNVRRTAGDHEKLKQLKASILSNNVLQSLLVRPTNGTYQVVLGGRRLTALQELVAEGKLHESTEVLCQLAAEDANDAEASLHENITREDMHPADEFLTFKEMADGGMSTENIAARSGYTERTVRQRLRLADVDPTLVTAYRNEEMTLADLMAFSITTDREQQVQVWKNCKTRGYANAGMIRTELNGDAVPSNSLLGRFVGLKAYRAAGGTEPLDLFNDYQNAYTNMLDRNLVLKLADKKLNAQAAKLQKYWNWVTVMHEVPWDHTRQFGRVRGMPTDPTPPQALKTEELAGEIAELQGQQDLDKDQTRDLDRKRTELQTLELKITARRVYSPEERALAGCIVAIGDDGRTKITEGLVRPDDIPHEKPKSQKSSTDNADAAAGAAEHTRNAVETTDDPPAALPEIEPPTENMWPSRGSMNNPEAMETRAAKKAGLGVALGDDLECIRTNVVRAHLAEDFDAAFDLLTFQLAEQVLRAGEHYIGPLDLTARRGTARPHKRKDEKAWAANDPGSELYNNVKIDTEWMESKDEIDRFRAFLALPTASRQEIFAYVTAKIMRPQLAFQVKATDAYEATAARMGINFASHIRPSADMFWKRVTRDRMMKTAETILGLEWTAVHENMKKEDLANAIASAFQGNDPTINDQSRANALRWSIPGFEPFDRTPLGEEADAETDADGDADAGRETKTADTTA